MESKQYKETQNMLTNAHKNFSKKILLPNHKEISSHLLEWLLGKNQQ